jgi:hypothetical protein
LSISIPVYIEHGKSILVSQEDLRRFCRWGGIVYAPYTYSCIVTTNGHTASIWRTYFGTTQTNPRLLPNGGNIS